MIILLLSFADLIEKIERYYLSLNTPDISSFNNLCSGKIGFIQPQKLDLTQ